MPSEESQNVYNNFFQEDRQIKDTEMLGKQAEQPIINKFNEVVVARDQRASFASKFRS
jgi:hypothetical protein